MAKILLVDDDERYLDTFAMILGFQIPGSEISKSSTIEQAVDELKKGDIDVLISEWLVGSKETTSVFNLARDLGVPKLILGTVYEPLHDSGLRTLLNSNHAILHPLSKGGIVEIKTMLDGNSIKTERI